MALVVFLMFQPIAVEASDSVGETHLSHDNLDPHKGGWWWWRNLRDKGGKDGELHFLLRYCFAILNCAKSAVGESREPKKA